MNQNAADHVQMALRTVQARMAAVLATLRLWEGHAPSLSLARRCDVAQDHISAQMTVLKTAGPNELGHAITVTECAVRLVRGIAEDMTTTGVLKESIDYRGRLLVAGLTKSLRDLQYWQDRISQ